jgi:ribosomal protein L35AE/L33A
VRLLQGTGAETVPREKILLGSQVKWCSANTPGRIFRGKLTRRFGYWGVVDGKIIKLHRLEAVVPLYSRFTGGVG